MKCMVMAANHKAWGKTVLTVTSATATQRFAVDVTSAVKDWYQNPSAKYGVVLQHVDENADMSVSFASADNPYYTATAPNYIISYRDTRGLDDRWAYSTQNCGSAGTGHVNLFNGNLVFIHDDITTVGDMLPVTVSHVYNSY